MRMWMVNPEWMCRQHLLGEHKELHMFVGTIKKGNNLDGYLSGLLEVDKIEERHQELVKEMKSREYNHKSPLREFEYDGLNGKIDRKESKEELLSRCLECKRRWNNETN